MAAVRAKIVPTLIGGFVFYSFCYLCTSCEGTETRAEPSVLSLHGTEDVGPASPPLTAATFPGDPTPESLEVAPDGTSLQEWERIKKEGEKWVRSRVAEFVPKLASSKPSSFIRLLFADHKTVITSLLAKMLPEGKRFKLAPRALGKEPEEVVRGPVLGIGTRGVVFEGTMVSSGEKFAMKIQHRQKGFFGKWPTRKEVADEMQQELAVADMLKHAYGPEGVLSKGMVLPVDTRRIHGYGEFITHPFTRTVFWNNITIFPRMKCTLADLVKVPAWPREARLHVAKRLMEIIAAVHEVSVVHSDIHEGNVFHKEGSGEVFFGDFGSSASKSAPGEKTFEERYAVESTRLGWLMLRVYSGRNVGNYYELDCSDTVSLSPADRHAVGPEDEIIQQAIRKLITCDKGTRLGPEDIVNVTPFFRREKPVLDVRA